MRFHCGISFSWRSIKRIIMPLIFGLIAFFGFNFVYDHFSIGFINAFARVKIETVSPTATYDVESNNAIDPTLTDPVIGPTMVNMSTSNWFTSLSRFDYFGNAKGSYLNVDADYYVAITVPNSNYLVASYINDTTRNTLKKENLRCAVNNVFKQGYSTSQGSPEISLFNARIAGVIGINSGAYQVVYRVQFRYRQHIPAIDLQNTNISCWFVQSPSNGLFAQHIMPTNGSDLVFFGYKDVGYAFSVTEDPVMGELINIQNIINNQTNILNEQTQIQQETYDYLTDNTPPDVDTDDIGGVGGLLPPGPVDSLLNLPVKYLSKIITSLGQTCSPYTFTFVFDEEMTLPCFGEFYEDFPVGVRVFTEVIPCGFILIMYFKHLYNKVDRATSLNTSSDDEWGVI